jgi:hypothetical protein
MSKLAVVEGEVVVKDGSGHAQEFYTEEFVLDDAVKTAAQARVLIKKGLITERLRRTVKNFKRVRTCQIVEFTGTDKVAEQSELDKLFLLATELNCVPENIDNYKRPDYKQKALERAIENARNRRVVEDKMKDEGYVD